MSDSTVPPLTLLGVPAMGVCEGDSCVIPDDHGPDDHGASIADRRVDADET